MGRRQLYSFLVLKATQNFFGSIRLAVCDKDFFYSHVREV